MARFVSGWVKFPRKVFDRCWIGEDVQTLAIYAFLRVNAAPADCTTLLKRQHVKLKRGQLATSAEEVARELALCNRLVSRRINELENSGWIVQQTSRHGRIITIVDYDCCDDTRGNLSDELSDTCPTRVRHVSDTRPHSEEGRRGEDNSLRTPSAHAPTRVDPDLLRQTAVAVLNRAAGAIHKGLDERTACLYVGEAGMRAILVRYSDFTAFRVAFKKRHNESSASIAEGQFRDAIASSLLDARIDLAEVLAHRLPDLTPSAGDFETGYGGHGAEDYYYDEGDPG